MSASNGRASLPLKKSPELNDPVHLPMTGFQPPCRDDGRRDVLMNVRFCLRKGLEVAHQFSCNSVAKKESHQKHEHTRKYTIERASGRHACLPPVLGKKNAFLIVFYLTGHPQSGCIIGVRWEYLVSNPIRSGISAERLWGRLLSLQGKELRLLHNLIPSPWVVNTPVVFPPCITESQSGCGQRPDAEPGCGCRCGQSFPVHAK